MHRRNVPGSGHWTRLNLFDGWQVFGTIGLVLGMLAFTVLIAQSRHVLPSTGSAIQLLQTLVSDSPRPEPTVQPTPTPSPSPSPAIAVIQPAQAPHVWHPPVRGAAPNPRPVATASATAAPTPSPVSAATPTPRPCDQKVCPTTSPTPTPSGP